MGVWMQRYHRHDDWCQHLTGHGGNIHGTSGQGKAITRVYVPGTTRPTGERGESPGTTRPDTGSRQGKAAARWGHPAAPRSTGYGSMGMQYHRQTTGRNLIGYRGPIHGLSGQGQVP
jgi:hypothetical protein